MLRTSYRKDSHLWKRPPTPVTKLALLLLLWFFVVGLFLLLFVPFLRPAQAEVLGGSFAGDKECFMGAG